MRYCKRCMNVHEDLVCPQCGKKNLDKPRDNDPVYLFSKMGLWAGVAEDMLKQIGVPYLKQGLLGAAMTVELGMSTELYRFYVPFGAQAQCQEAMAGMFDGDLEGAQGDGPGNDAGDPLDANTADPPAGDADWDAEDEGEDV